MRVTKVTDTFPLCLPEPEVPRSKGLHVSSLIRCIATETGLLKPEWADDLSLADVRQITDPVAVLRISIGLAWEKHYIPLIPGVTDHPGELFLDGIYMTHDGESLSTVLVSSDKPELSIVCHEVKATYKSTKTVGNIQSQVMWLMQIMAYCRALGTRFAMLHVLFLCGDYSFPIKPTREVWEIEFTQEEIDGNWKLLTDYRDYREKQDKGEVNATA